MILYFLLAIIICDVSLGIYLDYKVDKIENRINERIDGNSERLDWDRVDLERRVLDIESRMRLIA